MEEILALDKQWFLAINNGLACPFLDWLCPILREQATWYLPYALIVYYFYKHYGINTWKIILVVSLMIFISDQFSANLIKKTFMRIRPCNEPGLQGMVRHLISSCNGYSFVSAHAANHFALALLLIYYFKHISLWVIPVAILWACIISFSQIYVGVHYPLDVICGGLIGGLFGISFAKYSLKYIKPALINNIKE